MMRSWYPPTSYHHRQYFRFRFRLLLLLLLLLWYVITTQAISTNKNMGQDYTLNERVSEWLHQFNSIRFNSIQFNSQGPIERGYISPCLNTHKSEQHPMQQHNFIQYHEVVLLMVLLLFSPTTYPEVVAMETDHQSRSKKQRGEQNNTGEYPSTTWTSIINVDVVIFQPPTNRSRSRSRLRMIRLSAAPPIFLPL